MSYDELCSLNAAVAEKYHRHLKTLLEDARHPVTQYLAGRSIDAGIVDTWQLGYAPKDWQFLTKAFVEKGHFQEAVDLGVCVQDGQRNRDFFHERLIIPIKNERRQVIGFTGRTLDPAGTPKYMNIRTTVLFEKSAALFGIDQALRDIKLTKKAVLTEGNFDVTSLHRAGITNAVGKGGTALTEKQIEILLRLCDQVILIYDTDAAGQKALDENLERLLLSGLRVKVFQIPRPEGKEKTDADEWVRSAEDPGKLPDELATQAEDGFLLLADRIFSSKALDSRVEGIRKSIEILASMRDAHYRQEYLRTITKKYGLDQKSLSKEILDRLNPPKTAKQDEQDEFDDDLNLPDWVDREEYFRWGFAERRVEGNPIHTGNYFMADNGYLEAKPITNFIMRPLYHIKDRGNVRRLVEMDNGRTNVIVELPSKALNSVMEFETIVTSEGFFNTSAKFKRDHLKRITNKIMANTPEAFPVKTLGWQPEGFFAFSNAVYNGKLADYDHHGVVKVNDRYFFSPAISPINQYYRQEQDDYKFDKYLTFKNPEVTFAEWGRQMRIVYGDRAMVGIVFAITTLFKDIVRKSSKIPLLYCYGPKDSGKSTFAESILYLFFGGKDSDGELIKPLNLGAMPTGPAFWATMARFRNCPMLFNEFDENRIRDEFFTAFKSSWDGEGRVRGTMDKTKTEEQSVNCTVMLVGQYLSTKDDGSITSRSLCFEFASRKDNPFTPDEIAAFDKLRDWQKGNLSGILTGLLGHRKLMEEKYQITVRTIKKELTDELEKAGTKYTSRTFENVTCLLAVYETLKDVLDWPMTRDEIWKYCKTLLVEMSQLLQEGDALSAFWSMAEYLLDRMEIEDGWDFKIETHKSLKIATGNRKETREIEFEKPTNILYLRIGNVHKRYQEHYRKQSGDNPLSEQTLTTYLKQQGNYYIGFSHGTWFRSGTKGTSSSCYLINYDKLVEATGISLERFEEQEPDRAEMSCIGTIDKEGKLVQTGGKPVLEFTLRIVEIKQEMPFKAETYTVKCFHLDVSLETQLVSGSRWKVAGLYSEKEYRTKTGLQKSRQLDVTKMVRAESIEYDQGFQPLENAPF